MKTIDKSELITFLRFGLNKYRFLPSLILSTCVILNSSKKLLLKVEFLGYYIFVSNSNLDNTNIYYQNCSKTRIVF